MIRLMLVLLLVPSWSFAESTTEDPNNYAISLSIGFDSIHDRGKSYSELRLIDTTTPFFDGTDYAFSWSAFLGTDDTIGVEIYYPYHDWEFGWGIEYSEEGEDVVETVGKYQLRLGYNFTDEWSAQVFHKSNCRDICSKTGLDNILPHGGDSRSNKGYNYIGISYRYHF